MFAPNDSGGGGGATPAPQQPTKRTVTLTNRAPIRIKEDEWPVIAQGMCGEELPGAPCGWSIEIRVRKDRFGRCIIHGKYSAYDERDEDDADCNQTVRVGRLLSSSDSTKLWEHILAVGEEMRERIGSDKLRRYVTNAVDGCFANLPPHEM